MPGPSVFPSREPGVSGEFWGSQEGCQGPFRASHRPGAQASLSVRIQGEMVWGDFPFPLPFLPWPLHVHLLDSSPSACTLSVRRACGMWSLASELGCRSVSASPSPRRPLMQFQTFHLAWLGSQGPSGLLLSASEHMESQISPYVPPFSFSAPLLLSLPVVPCCFSPQKHTGLKTESGFEVQAAYGCESER